MTRSCSCIKVRLIQVGQTEPSWKSGKSRHKRHSAGESLLFGPAASSAYDLGEVRQAVTGVPACRPGQESCMPENCGRGPLLLQCISWLGVTLLLASCSGRHHPGPGGLQRESSTSQLLIARTHTQAYTLPDSRRRVMRQCNADAGSSGYRWLCSMSVPSQSVGGKRSRQRR